MFSLIIYIIQDKPEPLAPAALPKKATCVVCASQGTDHGEERVVAGFNFQGKAYYLCNSKEIEAFRADPESYLPPVLPRPAPEFDLKDLNGQTWNLDRLKQGTYLIDFWATWCKPCRELKPVLDKIQRDYYPKSVVLLSVSIDEKRDDLDRFLEKNKFDNPVLHDARQTWNGWKVKAIPTTFLVRDGMIVAQWKGKFKEAEVRKALDRALNEK